MRRKRRMGSARREPSRAIGVMKRSGGSLAIIVQTQVPSGSSKHTDTVACPRWLSSGHSAGAQFFHNLQIPAGFLQRAARVLFMTIVIAGGTGFLGSPLAEMYAEDGNEVRVLTRGLPSGESRHDPGTGVPGISRVGWTPDGGSGAWARRSRAPTPSSTFQASRWRRSAGRRRRRNIPRQPHPGHAKPGHRNQGSGDRRRRSSSAAAPSAIYGPSDDRALTERDAPGTDFLAKLCVEWEQEARQAERTGTRVVLLRTGVVLERSGGALPEMMRPFKFFAGGPTRIRTPVRIVDSSPRLDRDRPLDRADAGCERPGECHGAASGHQPAPLACARSRHAPAQPDSGAAFALKIVLGEFANTVLTGQRVLPACAEQHGYHFRYPEIEQAFRGIFGE